MERTPSIVGPSFGQNVQERTTITDRAIGKIHDQLQTQRQNTPTPERIATAGVHRSADSRLHAPGPLKHNQALQNAAVSKRQQTRQSKDEIVPAQSRTWDQLDAATHAKERIADQSKLSRPSIPPAHQKSMANAGVPEQAVQPYIGTRDHLAYQARKLGLSIPDRSSLLPPVGPNDVLPVGNWDSSDAWKNPRIEDLRSGHSSGYFDIDFTTRPSNDIKIRVAHTVRDPSGRQVVQRPIDPANPTQYPKLPGGHTPQQVSQHEHHGASHPVRQDDQMRLPPKEQAQVMTPNIGHPSTVKSEVDATTDGAWSTAHTSQYGRHAPENSKNLAPHLRRPGSAQVGNAVGGKAGPSLPTYVPPHLRPPKKDQPKAPQNQETNKVESASVPHAPGSSNVHAQESAPKGPPKNGGSQLETEGSTFLSQSASLFNTRRTPLAGPKTLATTAPTDQTSTKAPEANSVPIAPIPSHTTLPADSPIPKKTSQDYQTKDAGTHDSGHAADMSFADLDVVNLVPAKPNTSNASVRGKADQKLSVISGSLHFDETFQGRDPSDIYAKKPEVQLWDNPAPGPDHGNSLRGWDGEWGPHQSNGIFGNYLITQSLNITSV